VSWYEPEFDRRIFGCVHVTTSTIYRWWSVAQSKGNVGNRRKTFRTSFIDCLLVLPIGPDSRET